MAEIKSTLDLVMERTKHLTLSSEEKTGQRKKEFEKKLNGLLQQYADGALSIDELLEKMDGLQADLPTEGRRLAVKAVAQRIRPGLDNAYWLSLVKHMAPEAVTPLENALADFRDRDARLSRNSEERLRERLNRDYDIQGAAVVPNLRKDDAFQEKRAALEIETLTGIEGVIQRFGFQA